jgi:G:T-mismatch repair DNA endonuclease (very short patch repair protein)
LKQARPPAKQNLTRGEKTALKDLKSDETVLVTKADKGNPIVVMNRTDYQNQVTKMLEDTMVHKHITDKRRNPTTKTELELEKILKDLKRSENLTEKEYWQLKPFDSSPATFYGLPKVHKVFHCAQ